MKHILAAALLAFVPMLALAHTRWFAEGELVPYVPKEPTLLYMGVWSLIIVCIVAVGFFLERKKWFQFSFLNPKKPHVFERAASTFTMVTGTFFIIAGTHEYLFSPNLNIHTGIPLWMVIVEIAVGFALLLGVGSRVAGIVLGLLWASLFFHVGWIVAIENVWVLSTALFIALMGNEYFSIVQFSFLRGIVAPFKRYSLSILRVGTGLTLMILGLTEKIFAPEYGLNFLAQHDWNFMQMLGFVYSDYLFVLSAGSVEFLFGLVFLLGVVTRLNALVVAIVFFIPLFILGPIELAGHLPHFAAVVLLLLFGGGGHFTILNNKSRHQ